MTHSNSVSAPRSSGFASQVVKQVLPNGLTVLVRPVPGSGSVSICGKLRAGDAYGNGFSLLAQLAAYQLTFGSTKFSKLEISKMLQRMGSLSFFTDTFSLHWGATVIASNFSAFMELTAELLRHPLFDPKELDRSKKLLGAMIMQSAKDTGTMARNVLARKLYERGPYAEKAFDEIQAEFEQITPAMLQAFHDEHIVPYGGVITIVGDVDSAAAFTLLTRVFGDWTGPQVETVTIPAATLPVKNRFNVPVGDEDNLDVVIGLPCTVQRAQPDFYAARVANLILGGDTICSRLGVVRVKHSLTYGINSGFGEFFMGGAPWTIGLTTDVRKVERALALIADLVAKFLAEGVTDAEVANQASRASESFLVGLRTDLKVATQITDLAFIGLGVEELDLYPGKIKAVTTAEVNAALRRYFSIDNAVTVVCGKIS